MEKMDWLKLLSKDRFSISDTKDDIDGRTEFQRDIDRIIFSTAFRRLQNKTQVFPLPTNDFVHTRLTHSLEVAQVGRALGVLAGNVILQKEPALNGEPNRQDVITYTENDIADIIVASCLAHDLGNPPFGHSGEKAIGHYFNLGKGRKYIENLNEAMQNDFIYFEGNAAGLRILTNGDDTKIAGGFRLSYATLGTFIKYPTNSVKLEKNKTLNELGISINRKSLEKYNYFQSEVDTFEDICKKCGFLQISTPQNVLGNSYVRHPLAFLMEAADTICYKLIDLEDGHKVGLIDTNSVNELLNCIIKNNHGDINQKKVDRINSITDAALRVAPLRSRALRVLVHECSEVFKENYSEILSGKFDQELTDLIPSKIYLSTIKNVCNEKLYNQSSILEVELAGFEVMGGLLDFFLEAVLPEENEMTKKAIKLLPKQFLHNNEASSENEKIYFKIMGVVDFVSRMTDNYAMNIYKKVKGIESPLY